MDSWLGWARWLCPLASFSEDRPPALRPRRATARITTVVRNCTNSNDRYPLYRRARRHNRDLDRGRDSLACEKA